MKLTEYDKKWKPIFDLEKWLEERKPKKKQSGAFWDDVHLEYEEVLQEFKSFLQSTEKITDSHDATLTPFDIYNVVERYKIRIEKLMLIFDLKLYKTYNINRKTDVRYIVFRAFWIDHFGKPMRYFSRNIGAENKVISNGIIPPHLKKEVENYILQLMWDQYIIDYNDNYETGYDEDGNNVIIDD